MGENRCELFNVPLSILILTAVSAVLLMVVMQIVAAAASLVLAEVDDVPAPLQQNISTTNLADLLYCAHPFTLAQLSFVSKESDASSWKCCCGETEFSPSSI